ncbi:MAG: LytTR family DNA-binding domain-containing protein [Pseudomonadota bacterium]
MRPINAAVMIAALFLLIGYGVGPHYSVVPISARALIGLIWLLAATVLTLLTAPPILVGLYRAKLPLLLFLPIASLSFSLLLLLSGFSNLLGSENIETPDPLKQYALDAFLFSFVLAPVLVTARPLLIDRLDELHIDKGEVPQSVELATPLKLAKTVGTKETAKQPATLWADYRAHVQSWVNKLFNPFQMLLVGWVAFIFAVFGSSPILPDNLGDRLLVLVVWHVVGIPGFVLTTPIFEILLKNAPYRLNLILPVAFASFAVGATVLAILKYSGFEFGMFPLAFWKQLLIVSTSATLSLCIIDFRRVFGQVEQSDLDEQTVHDPEPGNRIRKFQASPELLGALPPMKRGTVLEVSAIDKYVELRTDKGTHLLRMPLKKAVSYLQSCRGELVHRSHWVAFDEMDSVFYEKGNPRLRLMDGSVRPISRKAIDRVKRAVEMQRVV